MNTLNRNIQKNEVVIVEGRGEQFSGWFATAFICDRGFGMLPNTAGGAIYGRWLDGVGYGYIHGYEINTAATQAFQYANFVTWDKAELPREEDICASTT